MLEVARVLGWASAAFLTVAIAAWLKLFRGPDLRRLDGGTQPDTAKAELASQILLLALGLSAIAAVLAVAGWFAF